MQSGLSIHPIGMLRSSKGVHFQALHQPDESAQEENVVELFPRPGLREALRDFEGMERIWLIWWFDRVDGWRPLVLPPRGPARRRGVLATRSPHRPNPIGITPVRLLSVHGLQLRLGPCDLLDGTPILDLKPYVPAFDAFPASRAGWIDAVEAQMALPARFSVEVEPLAREQLDWLQRDWGWRSNHACANCWPWTRHPTGHGGFGRSRVAWGISVAVRGVPFSARMPARARSAFSGSSHPFH